VDTRDLEAHLASTKKPAVKPVAANVRSLILLSQNSFQLNSRINHRSQPPPRSPPPLPPPPSEGRKNDARPFFFVCVCVCVCVTFWKKKVNRTGVLSLSLSLLFFLSLNTRESGVGSCTGN
jgi:hypothetical protein